MFCSAGAWWWDGVRGARTPAAPWGRQHPGDTPTPSPGTLLLQHGLIPKTAQGLSQMSPAAGRVGDSEGTRSSGVLLGRGGAQHRSLPAISKGPGGGALAQILLKMAKGGVLTCGSAPISASGESTPCRELTDTLQHPVPPPPHPPSTSRGAHLPLWAAGRGRHRAGRPAGWRHRSRPPGSGGRPGERADTGGGTHDGEGAEVVTDVTTVLFFFPSLPQNPLQVMLPAWGAHGAGCTPWGRGRGRDPGATSLQRAAGGCGLQEGGGAATSFFGVPP